MKASKFTSLRLLTAWELEYEAKKPFTKLVKGRELLEDAEWQKPNDYLDDDMVDGDNKTLPFEDLPKYGHYSSWNNLDHLAKTAEKLHPGFMNLWKWVKKTYPMTMRVSKPAVTHDFTPKDMDNFLRMDLVSLLTLLKYDLQGELNKWKEGLKQGNYFYSTPLASFCNDPEVN